MFNTNIDEQSYVMKKKGVGLLLHIMKFKFLNVLIQILGTKNLKHNYMQDHYDSWVTRKE